MNKGLLIGIAVLILGVGGYFLFSSGRGNIEESEPATSFEAPQSPAEDGSGPGEEGDSDITVKGDEFAFLPPNINLKKGEKIRLTFENTGSSPHNLVIDELGVATRTVAGGGKDTIEITPDKTGTFTFYCSVGNHRSLGMEGEVKID